MTRINQPAPAPLATVIALLLLASPLAAQNHSAAHLPAVTGPHHAALAKRLAESEKWDDLLREIPATPDAPAEIDFYRGLALANTGQLNDARVTLERGAAKAPRDKRFPIELAGVAYRQNNFAEAKSALHRALRLDPSDEYANNFLASIYFLESNLEAALKYWNRIGKPRLNDVTFDPQPRLDPALLDRAIPFSFGEPWRVADYLEMRANVEQLGIFARPQFVLNARADETYDLAFRAMERNGLGSGALEIALGLLRELPYQGIRAEAYNLRSDAMNWKSHFRWDKHKRRAASEFAAPLAGNPALGYRAWFDARNENWDFSRGLISPSAAAVNVQRAESGIELRAVASGRTKWSTGVAYSWRRFRNPAAIPAGAAAYFENGSAVRYLAGIEHSLLRVPEQRFTLDATSNGEFGRHFTATHAGYSRLSGALRMRWLPRARGDDDEIASTLRGGRAFGGLLFDELAMLGFERDSDLWLRGHAAARDGKKGSAPLGSTYLLWNLDYLKKIYSGGFFTVRAGPFIDAGRITDPTGVFGVRVWQWDTGAQARVRVLGGFEVTLGYGRDLRNSRNTFFTAVSR